MRVVLVMDGSGGERAARGSAKARAFSTWARRRREQAASSEEGLLQAAFVVEGTHEELSGTVRALHDAAHRSRPRRTSDGIPYDFDAHCTVAAEWGT